MDNWGKWLFWIVVVIAIVWLWRHWARLRGVVGAVRRSVGSTISGLPGPDLQPDRARILPLGFKAPTFLSGTGSGSLPGCIQSCGCS